MVQDPCAIFGKDDVRYSNLLVVSCSIISVASQMPGYQVCYADRERMNERKPKGQRRRPVWYAMRVESPKTPKTERKTSAQPPVLFTAHQTP